MLYQVDPDFRRKPPVDSRGHTVPYCAECQRAVDPKKAIPITINWETWHVLEGHNQRMDYPNKSVIDQQAYIGKDCWKRVSARHVL